MSSLKPREIAVSVLTAHDGGSEYVENRLEKALNEAPLPIKDRALAQELVYGTVRWQAALDWLIARKTGGRTQKATLQVLLRLGLYQMFWLDRIPSYAIVNETVNIGKKFGLGPQAGFLNAVLRGYDRERGATLCLLKELKVQQPSLGHSHPQWLCDRWQARWGTENMVKLLDWNNTPPPTFARVNTLLTDVSRLAALWEKEGVEAVPRTFEWAGDGKIFELIHHPHLSILPSFQQGYYYIQDPSTLLAVEKLDLHPGDTVLDMCAAPGGKTTYIAQCLQNQGQVLAMEDQPERLVRLLENCRRLGATCVTTEIPATASENPQFDKVLVDAPCSNSGVMRRRIELRWRLRPEEFSRLCHTQQEILNRAASRVKPGGLLVYSTCSLEAEENYQMIEQFLKSHADFRVKSQRQLLPFVDGVDGAFVAQMLRGAAC